MSNSMLTAALFTVSRMWKQPGCPSVDEWIEKMWYIYSVEYYSTIKKNEVLPFVTTWMDLDGMEKDRYHVITFICRTNEQT